jgi:phage gp36-like protein
MGEYCTIRDVRLALTPSADAEAKDTAASLPDWQIEDAISEAEGWVNTYILARYTIPSVEVSENPPEDVPDAGILVSFVAPSPVRGWTRDIAAYLATLTFRKHKDLGKDDPVRLRYAMVVALLEAIRDGKSDLPSATFPPADVDSTSQGVHVENLYEGKLFSPDDFGLGYGAPYQGPQVYWPVR